MGGESRQAGEVLLCNGTVSWDLSVFTSCRRNSPHEQGGCSGSEVRWWGGGGVGGGRGQG